MSVNSFDEVILTASKQKREKLAKHFAACVVSYHGPLREPAPELFRDFIEQEKKASPDEKRLVVVLNSLGGSAEVTEKLVRIMRHHYEEVYFIVPDYAMSAGTILCMSGDKIFMDYSSSLGPIDPQVPNKDGSFVPAGGYLEQVGRLLKSTNVTQGEALLLQTIDLGTLNAYERARELTVALLKEWLVKYKFKSWAVHRTDAVKKGQPVTEDDKKQRADEIARLLSDNQLWHSHGRAIGPRVLSTVLRLEIDDYSQENELRDTIREYHDLLKGWATTREQILLLYGKTRELERGLK